MNELRPILPDIEAIYSEISINKATNRLADAFSKDCFLGGSVGDGRPASIIIDDAAPIPAWRKSCCRRRACASGQLHIGDEHGNVQSRLNGAMLPEGVAGFGSMLETGFIGHIGLLTGAAAAACSPRNTAEARFHHRRVARALTDAWRKPQKAVDHHGGGKTALTSASLRRDAPCGRSGRLRRRR